MDVFAVIKARHDEARQVAQSILNTEDAAVETRQGNFTTFYNEIVTHHASEEHAVVPALNSVESMKEMGEDIIEDHKEIRTMLEELKSMDVANSQWMTKFRETNERLETHMEEEEHEISDEAHHLFDAAQLDHLAEDFIREERTEKEHLLAHRADL